MSLWGWFDCREVDEFADSIVADLVKRIPPDGLELPAKKASERFRKTHDLIFRRVEAFASARDLNVYKKARIGNRFKWALREAAYPPEFVDAFTHEVVTVVTLAAGKRKSAS